MPNPNDMDEADDYLHKLSHAICMVDGAALGVIAILYNARTVTGADIDAGFHAVIFGPVLGILQNVTQLFQLDLQAVFGVSHAVASSCYSVIGFRFS